MNNTKSILDRADEWLDRHEDNGGFTKAAELIRDMRDYIAGMGWQPIESAPKQAVIFLACNGAAEYYCRWAKGKWCYWGLGDYDNMDWVELLFIPTHWQPLPPKPEDNDGR